MNNNVLKTFAVILVGCVLLNIFGIYRTLPTRSVTNISENTIIERLIKFLKEERMSTQAIKRPINDFVTFPCVPKYTVTSLLGQGRCVRTVNVDLLSINVQDYECVDINLNMKSKICIYDPRKDKLVSATFYNKRVWEKRQVDQFGIAIDRYGVTDVLDLGCNIGIYTIKAAQMGKKVVSLDANVENHRLVAKSLVLGNIKDRVTQVWNAISDVYTNVTVNVAFRKNNIGGGLVEPVNNKTMLSKDAVLVETIKLDDLEGMFKNKVVAIKIDVEGCELMALKGGTSFLKNINVRFMQMEIAHHTKKPTGEQIVSIMRASGFEGYKDCLKQSSLKDVPVKSWPWDVCFVKLPM